MKSPLIMGVLSIMMMSNGCKSPKTYNKAIDPVNMDLTVNPTEDFYQYANGGWMKNNPLKPEFSRYGAFDKLMEDNQERLKILAEKLAVDTTNTDPIARKTSLFFLTAMDSAKAQLAGFNPIKPYLSEIDKITTNEAFLEELSSLHKDGISPLFNLFAEADSKNSSMVITWLYQGGLGMPDRDYYTDNNQHASELRSAYTAYVTKMFELTGSSQEQAFTEAKTIMNIETRLAKASLTRLEQRDPNAIYHKVTRAELQKSCPAINWDAYFSSLGIPNTKEINLAQPVFFKEVSDMLKEVSLTNWKIYLKWSVINETAPYLSPDFETANFDFYGKALSGKQQMQPRWKKAINACNSALGMALGQEYVKEYFPPEAKDRMLALVENLRNSLKERIGQLEWMSDTTKQKAIEKLDAMKLKIGYPDKWRDYSGLEITNRSFAENMMSAHKFNMAYMLSKINKPVDHEEWGMTPQTVNAYYEPSRNEIVFPAGILQPPFFFLNGDDAVNYGAIGMVIGHEMTHGFDDEGRKYDKDGNLSDWWTAEDAMKFEERTRNLVEQYNSYTVLDSTHANGELTLGENIADLGGMFVSITAFSKTSEAQKGEEIDGFTPMQRFFLAYAHVWAQNIRDKEILRRTKEDVHSLGMLRVIVPLKNLPQFYTAFNVKEGSAMFHPEQDRALIW